MSSEKTKILSQEMTRKQFLQLIAGSSLMLFGFGNLVTFFKNMGPTTHAPTSQNNSHGFGSSKFGV